MNPLLKMMGFKPVVGIGALSLLSWLFLLVGLIAPSPLQYALLVLFVGVLCFEAFRVAAQLESLEKQFFALAEERDYFEQLARRVGKAKEQT